MFYEHIHVGPNTVISMIDRTVSFHSDKGIENAVQVLHGARLKDVAFCIKSCTVLFHSAQQNKVDPFVYM